MGCWNETCVLTRTPICAGEPVVALATVRGPDYREPAGGSFKTPLVFGLPYMGDYDDYGGVENQEHPERAAFAERAFVASGLYRRHVRRKSPISAGARWIASGDRVFWGKEEQVKHLFYDECGVTPADVDSYDKAASDRTAAAYKRATVALERVGQLLANATLPEEASAQDTALFDIVKDAFGASSAWSALDLLRRGGLFAVRHHVLMHRPAYDVMVADFGGRKVSVNRAGSMTVREYCGTALDSWVEKYEAELARQNETFSKLDGANTGLTPASLRRLVQGMAPRNRYIEPMTSPWQTPELPLVGHFWGGATVSEILAAYDREHIVDFFVFQWARHALRIELTAPTSGSQSRETRLLKTIQDAVYAQLAAGSSRADHDLYVHD